MDRRIFIGLGLGAAIAVGAQAEDRLLHGLSLTNGYETPQPAQVRGDFPETVGTWDSDPVVTVGETRDGYTPPGILDGMGAYRLGNGWVRVLVNHELTAGSGYEYELGNGTPLTGARVSFMDISQDRKLIRTGAAYRKIHDRYGEEVTSGYQISEGQGSSETDGIDRLCSANLYEAGEYNLEDTIFFTGEETGDGQEYALDAATQTLWTVPWLGRAAWESVCLLETGDENTVAIAVGDDREAAPLLLYVGQKNHVGDGSFLDRNGLAFGDLYIWAADDGSTDPEAWNGTGTSRTGTFVKITHYDETMAGMPGWDDQGFADQATQDAQIDPLGGFRFSRPEDVATNPEDGTQFVLASTGRGSRFPSDNWGTTYLVDVDFGETITAELSILYDGDDAGAGQFADPDFGLRSPDNLDWADNGKIYLQEDRSTSPGGLFGGVSGVEASIWELDPATGILARIAHVDRSAVPDDGQEDTDPTDLGDWETSGILDVTELFETVSGERLLIANSQAHSLRGGPVDDLGLVQGGQLYFLSTMEGERAAGRTTAPASVDLALSASPNPFRAGTAIHFQVAEAGEVLARVFDATGREVSVIASSAFEAGVHAISWDGTTTSGRALPAGVYYVEIRTSLGTSTEKLMLLR